MNFNWADFAFGSKKPLNDLKATFIAAPRELSVARFTQLVKEYLPQGNILLGISAEPYVLGFERQPQFRMLDAEMVQPIIDQVAASSSAHKIYTLEYSQRDLSHILAKLKFRQVIFVNGSWKYSFHTQKPYYTLMQRRTPYALVSPFASEAEAKDYASTIELTQPPTTGIFSDIAMLELAANAAEQSFDNSFQTGVSLGRKQGVKYQLLATGFNKVVPYQTYAMHHGASRETNFSPPNDLNHYDTTHAEVELLLTAQKKQLDLHDTTVFINLLPCPSCARMLSQTDIAEFVYREDHSEGYAIKMLELAGKKVRRMV